MLFKRKNAVGIGGRVNRDRDELDVFLAELSAVGARADTIVDSLWFSG